MTYEAERKNKSVEWASVYEQLRTLTENRAEERSPQSAIGNDIIATIIGLLLIIFLMILSLIVIREFIACLHNEQQIELNFICIGLIALIYSLISAILLIGLAIILLNFLKSMQKNNMNEDEAKIFLEIVRVLLGRKLLPAILSFLTKDKNHYI